MNSSRLRFLLFADGMLCNSCYGRGVCAVECVTAHVCCFQEDLGAEAVFCIDGWSTALGNTTVYVGVTIFAKRLDFFRFHVVRTETCLTLLCRVHRYLLKSAITVCLMGHTAVQTSVAQRVRFHLSRATQSATLSSASICRRMMCCHKIVLSSGTHMFQEVYERMTKDMTASAPCTLKIMVVAPPDGNIITVGAKRLAPSLKLGFFVLAAHFQVCPMIESES